MRAALALFGYRSVGRMMVGVVVDSLLNVLYTADKDGNIDLFDLGVEGNQTTQKVLLLLCSCCFALAALLLLLRLAVVLEDAGTCFPSLCSSTF